jgi:hypothetical protein
MKRFPLIYIYLLMEIIHVAEYIVERQPLGGLLFLLPLMFSFENRDGTRSNHQDHGNELLKNVMAELEQLLIHANVPVSGTYIISFLLRYSRYIVVADFVFYISHLLVFNV